MNIDQVQAVFFDFDGVILDSTRIKTKTFQEIYAPFGDEVVKKVLRHHLQHGGISRVEKIPYYHREFLGQTLSREELEWLCLMFSENVKDAVVRADWIPGAEDFIKSHHNQVDLFIISGTPQEELTGIVRLRRLERYFKRILGSPVEKPDHVRSMVNEFGLQVDHCFFIGDALTDLNAAVETGVHFIGIQGEIPFPEGTTVLADCTTLNAAIEIIP